MTVIGILSISCFSNILLVFLESIACNGNEEFYDFFFTVVYLIFLVLSHLFVKVPRPGDSKVTFSVFESSYHLLLPVYPLKSRGPVAFPKNTTSELSGLFYYTLSFKAERQAGKL